MTHEYAVRIANRDKGELAVSVTAADAWDAVQTAATKYDYPLRTNLVEVIQELPGHRPTYHHWYTELGASLPGMAFPFASAWRID